MKEKTIMEIMNVKSIIESGLVFILYMFLCKYQRVIFKESYFSVQDIAFSKSKKIAIPALISRFIFILVISIVFSRLFSYDSQRITIAIFIGSFLLTWPSIYYYRLAYHRRNQVKRSYFWGCILSMIFSLSSVMVSMKYIIPALFDGKDIFVYSNSGFQAVLWLLGLIMPLPLLNWFRKDMDSYEFSQDFDTFYGDLRILENRLYLEKSVIEDYEKYIKESALKNKIPYKLLFLVLSIEYINRESWSIRSTEWLVCRFFPLLAKKWNISVGLAQLKISTVKQITDEPVKTFIMKLFAVLRYVLNTYQV